MSFKTLKTSVAIASVATLATFGLVAAPAQAAVGDVSIAPKTGTGTTAFSTDNFTLTTEIKTSKVAAATLAYRIDNPDQHQLHIDTPSSNADIFGIKADGSTIATGIGDDKTFGSSGLAVDFKDLAIVSLLIFELDTTNAPAATGNDLVIQLDEATVSNAASGAVNPFEHNDLTGTAELTVTAWVETAPGAGLSDYLSIDSEYSSSTTVTFVDPADVSAVSTIERFDSATGNDAYAQADSVAVAASTVDVVVDDSSNALLNDATIGGVAVSTGDLVLLTNQDAAAENGLYTVPASGNIVTSNTAVATDIYISSGASAGVVFSGDGTNTLTAITATDQTVTAFNDGGENFVGGTLRFSNANINLAQVNLANWEFELDGAAADDTGYLSGSRLNPVVPAGFSAVDSDGKLYIQAPVKDLALDDGQTYKLKVRHSEATAVEYLSAGSQVVTSPSVDADQLGITISDTVNASTGAFGSSYPVTLRNGTTSLKFGVQVEKSDNTNVEVANIPVLAVVTAGPNFPAGETLSVSGANRAISKKGQSQIVSALSDSDGEWELTVTSSDASSAGAVYTVEFFVLEGATPDVWRSTDGTNRTLFTVDYAGPVLASANAFTADSPVLSGDSVTATFSIVDQYGSPLSQDSKGKAYSVELKASNSTNLDLDVAVVNGSASFTFENFLGAGGSDVLTAKLYTGSSTSPSYVSSQTTNVTLYNTNAIAGVNVTDEITGVVMEYTDFFNGKAVAGQKVPVDSNKNTLTGTVVDSNGAGVPGAPVTISATGFAFEVSNTYAVDSIDVVANESGSFSVDFWTHQLSSVGVNITVTSGDKSSTTKVKSVLPAAMNPGNMVFSWNVPSAVVTNTTYAVTASLTDVFGNPLAGQTLTFTGLAAANFNGTTSDDRTTDKNGNSVAYLRSLKDVDGLAAIDVQLKAATFPTGVTSFSQTVTAVLKDDSKTSWDESTWDASLDQEINFLKTAPTGSADAKVNAGSFKGYVAVYAKGYEGKRLSAKIGNDWVIIPSLASSFERIVDFTGAGVDIAVRIYIDRVLIDTINLTTK